MTKISLANINESISDHHELVVASISGLCWAIGGIYFLVNSNVISSFFFIPGILLGAYYPLLESFKSISNKELNIDVLMIFAAIGAIFLGHLGDAALLLFLFSLGHALEGFALNKVKKTFSDLNNLKSDSAILKKDKEYQEVPIESIKIGDLVLVKPGSRIPVDGIVVDGESYVDQAAITGESIPVFKSAISTSFFSKNFDSYDPRHKVFSGTINGHGVIEIKVMKLFQDSTLSRLVRLVNEAEEQKSNTQHLADNFEKYYVPAVLILVTTLMFSFLVLDERFEISFYRAMATLIAASPCALAISTPSAVLAGIARAAKQGILIKGGRALEELAYIDAIAFDKTGTLTKGKPRLDVLIPYGKMTDKRLLDLTASVELLSDHPIAKAIINEIENLSELPIAKNIESITARGVRASVEDEEIFIGNRRLLEEITSQALPDQISKDLIDLEMSGKTVLIVYFQNEIIGMLGVMDTAREEAFGTINQLKNLGVHKLIMISGDNQAVASAVAETVGIEHAYGNLLPEDKVGIIEKLGFENYKVAMVGDGVNDAPALARASLGIAMGAARSDVALETADIALMSDKLENLPFAIRLSRKAKKIITQNLFISMGMVSILVPLTILGIAEIGPAVVGHEGSTIVVVLNALRLLTFKDLENNYNY